MTTSGAFDRQVDQPMLFAEGSPASRSARPGSDEARQMTAISGRKWLGLLPKSGPLGSLGRMLLESSAWRSTACFLTWKAWATPSGRWFFRLAPSMRRTEGTAYGLWATPTVVSMEHPGRIKLKEGQQIGLSQQVNDPRLWPTPRTTGLDGGSNSRRAAKARGMRPTPTVSMRKGASQGALTRTNGQSRENDRLDYAVLASGDIGSLNPTWVEWLMGFPAGWTDLEPSATPSSRKSSKS